MERGKLTLKRTVLPRITSSSMSKFKRPLASEVKSETTAFSNGELTVMTKNAKKKCSHDKSITGYSTKIQLGSSTSKCSYKAGVQAGFWITVDGRGYHEVVSRFLLSFNDNRPS